MKILIPIIAVAAFLTSCSSLTYPGMVTANPVGSKVGVAKRTVFLGISFGHTDLGLATAAKNGKITRIATVDYKIESKMFKTTYSTIVTGE